MSRLDSTLTNHQILFHPSTFEIIQFPDIRKIHSQILRTKYFITKNFHIILFERENNSFTGINMKHFRGGVYIYIYIFYNFLV